MGPVQRNSITFVKREGRFGLQVVAADVALVPLVADLVRVVGVGVPRADVHGGELGQILRNGLSRNLQIYKQK
jgi:hypothetical protein